LMRYKGQMMTFIIKSNMTKKLMSNANKGFRILLTITYN
jgi:hypothetical protein